MSQSNVSFMDAVVMIVKWKTLFVKVALAVSIVSYAGIYLFIDEEYEATATIVPSEDKQLGGISSIMKSLGNLPIGGLKGTTVTAEMDLYVTIITSRSMMERIIAKFDLQKEYDQPSMEKTIKRLRSCVRTKVTEENAFEVTVRGSSPGQAVEMAEFILDQLNGTIVQLNIQKSRNNRLFLQERYEEVNRNLRIAEDSLQLYQQHSGMLEVKEQSKLVVAAYTTLEAELMTKQLELSILERTVSPDAPAAQNLRVQVSEYERKMKEMKEGKGNNSVILALNALPMTAKNYIRHYRDVEIYSTILEFLVPLYEQAKFEEQKEVPVLQIIDHPRTPEKKAYPPRVLFASLITLGALIMTYVYILLQEHDDWKRDPKISFIRTHLLPRKTM